MYSVNPLHLILDRVNGQFKEINGNKSLTLVPTNKSKNKKKLKSIKNYGLKSETQLGQLLKTRLTMMKNI